MKTLSSLLLTALLVVAHSASAQSIVGAWTYGNTSAPDSSGTGVLVFLPNGVYFHIESENADDHEHGFDGMERGTYSWNASTGAFSASTLINTNGQWGLSDDIPPTISVTGNLMDIDGTHLTRVSGSSAIVGAWTYGNTTTPDSTGTGVLVFLENGAYFHAESENLDDSANGNDGMERGTYLWSPGDGAFSSFTAINTNGQWGLSHGSPDNIFIFGDTMDIEGFLLTRVSAVPEPSTYAMLAGLAALGLTIIRRQRRTRSIA